MLVADHSTYIRGLLKQSGTFFREGPSYFTIQCLNPSHPDIKKRDMKIYKKSGRAYCFSCKHTLVGQTLADALGVVYEKVEVEKKVKYREAINEENDTSVDLPAPRGFTKFEVALNQLSLSAEVVKCFGIGYCKYGFSGRAIFKECIQCRYKNFYSSENDFCEFAAGRILIPIVKQSRTLAYESRDLTLDADKKVLYPTGSKTSQGIWNYDNLDRSKTLYVVEGVKSALKLYQGFNQNVTAIFSNRLKGSQGFLLREFNDIVLIPDRGRAGDETVLDFQVLRLNKLRVIRLPEIPICKKCAQKLRKGTNLCPKCKSDDLNLCDAYDFSTDMLNDLALKAEIVLPSEEVFSLNISKDEASS